LIFAMESSVSISQEKLFNHLEKLHSKYESVSEQLSNPEVIKNQIKLKKLSKQLAGLKPIKEHYLKMKKFASQRLEAEILFDTTDEADMKDLAREEIEQLDEKIQQIEQKIIQLLVIDTTDENRNVFLEIRAGAGGNEASLFASDLLRMYSRIAEQNSWKFEIISTTYSAIGGIKEIILHITGNEVNQKLQFESGVHRVQRVPITEASGRIHTSTVTVAVMPEVDDVEIQINSKDIRIDTFSASGPGGQHVNRTQSAIRITHNPTGIVVTCQDEKSQHKNKDKALKVLKARLYEFEQEKQKNNIANSRKSQVGSGERSEKIRTYNFPQNRVTDHRITGKNFNLETILNGLTNDLFETLYDGYSKKMIEEKLNQIIA
jgi:peptide chain release factor 1